jgi:hypothetical protein
VTDDGTSNGTLDALTSAAVTVNITVNAVNDAPMITSISLPEDTLIYSNIDGQQQVIVRFRFEDIDSENLQISYLDSGNVIDSYPIVQSIDSMNIILDTLDYIFNYGEHVLTIIIQDDGDNEDITSLSVSDSVAWNLGYATLDLDENGYYVVTDSIRTLPEVQIWNGEIDNTINMANGILLSLPDNSNFKWASSQDINLFGSYLISDTLIVSEDRLTLAFTVNANFTSIDSIRISGLRLVDLNQIQAPTNIRIIVDGISNYNTANAESAQEITIGNTKIELSRDEAFSLGDPATIDVPFIRIWEESPYSVMNKDIGIHLKIPSTLHCYWNDTSMFDIFIFQNDGNIAEIVSDSISITDSILSIALTENLASDDTVKITGSLFRNFDNISFPSPISLAVTTPEPEDSPYFERETEHLIRIGDPQLVSIGDHLLIMDMDSSYSDTLMPVQFIEHDDVPSITKSKGIVLRLPENSGLLWASDKFGEIVKSESVGSIIIHPDGGNMIQINFDDDLSAGDTITIRRLPIENIVNSIYNDSLDCSTNGDVSFNRTDHKGLSIGHVEIYSADQSFLLNDTTQSFPIHLIQDPELELISQQYGMYLFLDEFFPAIFDSTQESVYYNYSNEFYNDSVRFINEKKIQILLSNDIAPGDSLQLIDLRFSGFTHEFSGNNVLSISVKDQNRSTFSDSTIKGIGKPGFTSEPRLALSGSVTSILMPRIIVSDDSEVGVIKFSRNISFILSDDRPMTWQQVPLLEIAGSYEKVNPIPIYSENQKRLSISVIEDFTPEDTIYVSGLRVQVDGSGNSNLYLSLNENTYQDTILNWVRSGAVSFNSSDQIFLKNIDLDQRVLSRIKIGQGEISMIDSVNDLILRLPLDSYFRWYDEQNPFYSFFGDQTGSISDEYIISEDGKSLRLPVEYFPINDTLFIDSLRFAELTNSDSIHLLLGIDGENNSMVLEDPALKIIVGFEFDYENSWNFVLGDSGRFAVLPDIVVINDGYNTFPNTDVHIALPDDRLTWKSSIDSIGIIQDSILIKYGVNLINDTLLHIPSGMPLSQDEMIKITGLQLNAITDTLYPINPYFIFSLANGNQSSHNVNEITVSSSIAFGIGNPKLEYDSNISLGLNEELLKSIPTINISESSVPVFGPHRDLAILSLNDLNEKIIFNNDGNWSISDPGFIKSVNADTIVIGFFRYTNPNEIVQLIDLTMTTEPFFSTGHFQDINILSGSMTGAFGISYKIEQDAREQLIDMGPDIELYPSLLFSQPEFSVNNDQYQIGVYLFPSIIDNQNTLFNSVMDIKHSAISGLFSNDLSEQFGNFTILHNQNYSFSDSLVVPFDKLIITMDPSVADTINKYADLNRYYSVENDLVLNLNRAGLIFESNIDTTGFRIVRSEDNRDIDIGYSLDSIFLEPNLGIISNNAIDSLKLQLSEFPFIRHLIIKNMNQEIVSDTVFTDKSESTIQLSGEFIKDGIYYVLFEGIINDSSSTIPIKRQFKLDNTIPSFNFDATDSLALMLMSKGKEDVGHLVAMDQSIEISILDLNETVSPRNDVPNYFFDDSLKIRMILKKSKNPDIEFEKNFKLDIENIDSEYATISMTFDSLLSFILASEYSLLKKDAHNFDFVITVSDPAGNTNIMDLFFSIDLTGKSIGDEFFNYPNPFSNLKNEHTNIRYVLLKEQESGVLYIIDLGGDMVHVSELEDSYLTTGSHEIKWNGRNLNGDLMSSGVYLGLLKMDELNKKIKIVIRN